MAQLARTKKTALKKDGGGGGGRGAPPLPPPPPPPPPPQVTFHAPCSGGVCENDIFVFLFFLIRYIQKHVLKIWNKTVSLYQNVSVAVSMSMMSGFVDVENN